MPEILKLPKIKDPRGNLSFIQSGHGGVCPFEIESVAWCYDIPGGCDADISAPGIRAALGVALSGSYSMGETLLNRSDCGILLPPGKKVCFEGCSTNSVGLLLESAEGGNGGEGEEDARGVDPASSHRFSDVSEARIIDLPRVALPGGGSLTRVANGDGAAPFDVRRIFYLYDVPADAARGGHSHYVARELIVAMSGSFDVVLDDGKHAPRRFPLNRPYQGLFVPAGLWRTLDNFSGGAVSAVLTSHRFSEADYVRDYSTFLKLTNDSNI